MRIAIVDDERDFSEKVEKIVRSFFEGRVEKIGIRCLSEGYTLLNELEEKRNFDVYFLDVEMPGINGLELAKKIRAYEEDANIVFITNYDRYAIPSYKIGASYYVLKSEYEKEILEALGKIWKDWKKEQERRARDLYVIRNEFRCTKVVLDEVLYVTKEKKYVIFHCIDQSEHKERDTLNTVYQRLPRDRFIFVNKGCIINMKYVSGLEKGMLRLRGGNERMVLSVSRYMEADVRKKLLQYWEN